MTKEDLLIYHSCALQLASIPQHGHRLTSDEAVSLATDMVVSLVAAGVKFDKPVTGDHYPNPGVGGQG